jgi:SnoaL-like domain
MTRQVNEQNVKETRPSAGDAVEHVRTLLKRNIAEVFGEGDPTRRRKAIEEIYAEDAVVYVPPGTIVGHKALDKFAGELRATHPHYVYTPFGEPQVLHNSARVAWGSGPRGEPPAYTGEDVIVVRDGKISTLYVYLDQPPV